ncbi:MAG TPA: SRPBCC domain-containing protein [Terracidiphilus sp.]
MPKLILAPLAFLALLTPGFSAAQNTADSGSPSPEKLVIECEVPAAVSDVWRAFSTSEGLSTWLTPEAVVDLRPGGEWTARFPGGSTGGGTIISFVPEKEIVVAALAPDKFPHVRAERTRAVFQFEPRGKSTVVRLTQTGWKSGDEWTRAYEYLLAGNAQLMAMLHRRFVDGPTDWKKVFGDSATKGK